MSDPRIPSAEQEANVRKLADYPLPPSPPFDEESVEIFALIQKYLVAAIAWADAERDRADTAERERDAALAALAAAEARVVELTSWHDDEKTWRVGAERELARAGRTLGAVVMAAHPLALGEERVPTQEDEHSAVQAVLGVVGERDRIAEDRDDTETQRHAAVRRYMRAEERIASLVAQVEAAETREREAERELKQWREWDDADDEWSAATAEAFPTRSGSHEAYATAMAMVSHRQSKGNLVELVNWLLVRITAAETREREAVARADRLAEASREAGVHPVNQDTCGVCGKHFDECEEDTSHCGDGVMFPSCAGARIRAVSAPLALPPEPDRTPNEHEFPNTVVHMHLDGAARKYIPVDGEELKEMLAKARADAFAEVVAWLRDSARADELRWKGVPGYGVRDWLADRIEELGKKGAV